MTGDKLSNSGTCFSQNGIRKGHGKCILMKNHINVNTVTRA